MTITINDIEKIINSGLATSIKKSEVKFEQLFIEVSIDNLISTIKKFDNLAIPRAIIAVIPRSFIEVVLIMVFAISIFYLLEFKNFSREEIFKQRQEKFLSIGKQKAFTVFLRETPWMKENNFFEFIKKNLFKFKKELIIICLLIFAATLFLI